jgi:D-3-phosphoglycerate dehydrogenase / 2-oxoglutarate reductase
LNIKGLFRGFSFKESLSGKLKQFGLEIEYVNFDHPLESQLANAQVIVNGFHNIDRSIIDACPNLRLVQQSGIGVDNIDIKYCTLRGIYVANVPLANAISVAEHTLFLMLYLAKNVSGKNAGDAGDSTVSGLLYKRSKERMGMELHGRTLVIIGLGVTGLEVAKRARNFGMRVEAVTKHPFANTQGIDKKYFVDDLIGTDGLAETLARADIVSIHTPLTNETEAMFGERELSMMKKSAYLINVARAHIVDKRALFLTLSTQKIAGAAFDVFWTEPPDRNDSLLTLDNFVLTPHIAGWTSEAIEAITRIIAINIERMSRGEIPLTVVNQELLV